MQVKEFISHFICVNVFVYLLLFVFMFSYVDIWGVWREIISRNFGGSLAAAEFIWTLLARTPSSVLRWSSYFSKLRFCICIFLLFSICAWKPRYLIGLLLGACYHLEAKIRAPQRFLIDLKATNHRCSKSMKRTSSFCSHRNKEQAPKWPPTVLRHRLSVCFILPDNDHDHT